MTATDELRRLLNERGVEYKTDDTSLDTLGTMYYCTSVKDPIVGKWIYEEPPDTDLIIAAEYDVGAEDAIAATLGSGTCHVKKAKKIGDLFGFSLSCGHSMVNPFNDHPDYCPWCGRKVVDG